MQVQLSGILSQAAGGARCVECAGATIGELLHALLRKYPEMQTCFCYPESKAARIAVTALRLGL